MQKNEIVLKNNNTENNINTNNIQILNDKNSQKEILKTPEDLSLNNNNINLGNDINPSNLANKNIEPKEETQEEKNKELFINRPVLYFFIKILLLFEGQITRILMQIGDLYIVGIITNTYLQIIVIQLCAVAESNAFAVIFGFISALIFAFLMKIIVTISYWELYQLKWFDINPFGTIFILLNIKLKHYMIRNIYYITYIVLGVLFWVFIISVLTMYYTQSKFFDAMTLIIFIIIPGLKFILIYLSYLYIGCRKLVVEEKDEISQDNPFLYWIKLNDLIDQGVIKIEFPKNEKDNNNNDGDEKLGCFKKLIFKEIIFELKLCNGKIIKISLSTSLKIFFTFFSFIYLIYLFAKKGATVGSVFYLIITYLICLILWIQFPTPSWLTNSIYRWHLKFKNLYDRKHQLKCRVFNVKFSAFKVLDSLPLILSITIWVVFIGIILIFALHDSFFVTADEKINQQRNFTKTDWPREYSYHFFINFF